MPTDNSPHSDNLTERSVSVIVPTADAIEKDQYEQLREIRAEVKYLAGKFDAVAEINGELVKLMRRESNGKFCIILFLVAALIYGALGEHGFNAVKHIVPMSGRSSDSAQLTSPICSPPDTRVGICMNNTKGKTH